MVEDIIIRPRSNLEGQYMQTLYQLFVESGTDLMIIDEWSGPFFDDCVDFGVSEGILRYSGFLENKTFQNHTSLTYSLTEEGKRMFNFLDTTKINFLLKKNIYKPFIPLLIEMERGAIRYLVFALGLILLIGFVFAASGSLAPSTAEAGDNVKMLWFNVTNTSSTGNNLTQITLNITGTASFGNISSVNISDGTTSYSNGSITGSTILVDVSNAQITEETNFTVNFTLSSNATWNETLLTFQAYVTAITNQANVTVPSTPFNSSLVKINESTAPTISAPQSIDSSRTSISTDFSTAKCSDSGAAASGLSTCVLSSSDGTIEDGDKITGLSCGTSYDITITGTDNAGNSATSTASLSTQSCSGGGVVVPPTEGLPTKTHSFSKITPGVASIVKDFDSEIGIKEITINVNNEAQNVKITVTKHDGKPAAVSVEKSGVVYQYLQIEEENLGSSLNNAVVEFRVEKSWVSDNGLQRDDVSVYRFDESASSWEELETTFSSEDSTHNYYTVELDSFSYFAISASVADGTTGGDGITGSGNLTWLWILIAVVLVVAVWMSVSKKKKKK